MWLACDSIRYCIFLTKASPGVCVCVCVCGGGGHVCMLVFG